MDCRGKTKALCSLFQKYPEPCCIENLYHCTFESRYADGTRIAGVIVNDSVHMPTSDKSSSSAHAAFA